jgi:hypothetical protein
VYACRKCGKPIPTSVDATSSRSKR